MIKKYKTLVLGFIFSISIFLYIYFITSMNEDSLKELSFYYQSIGQNDLSFKYKQSYYFFNNLFLYIAFLLVPTIMLLNHYFIKNNVFIHQLSLITFTGAIILNYEKYFSDLNFKTVVFLLMWIIIIIYNLETIYNEIKGTKKIEPYKELSQIEIFYYLILINLYFFILTRTRSLTDFYVIFVIILSYFLVFYLPSVYKKHVKIKTLTYFKPISFILLLLLLVNIINSSIYYIKFSQTHNQFPKQLVLNKETAFGEYKGDLKRTCGKSTADIDCALSNYYHLFDKYYFKSATLEIDSPTTINLLNNTNYNLKLFYYYSLDLEEKESGSILIDDFTTTNLTDVYTISINLDKYLKHYELKDYNYIKLSISFVNQDTNETIHIDLSDYQIIMTK